MTGGQAFPKVPPLSLIHRRPGPRRRNAEGGEVCSEAELQEGPGCPERGRMASGIRGCRAPPWASEVALAVQGEKLLFADLGVALTREACGLPVNQALPPGFLACPSPCLAPRGGGGGSVGSSTFPRFLPVGLGRKARKGSLSMECLQLRKFAPRVMQQMVCLWVSVCGWHMRVWVAHAPGMEQELTWLPCFRVLEKQPPRAGRSVCWVHRLWAAVGGLPSLGTGCRGLWA